MKLKKFIASVMATALVGTTMAMASTMTASAVSDSYTVALNGTVGSTQHWDGDAPTCTVTGDGDYTITFNLNEATESTDGTGALILSSDINVYDFVAEGGTIADSGIVMSINSVKVDGTEVAYSGPSDGAYTTNDDGKTLRLNIYNMWGNNVSDIDFNFSVESSIEVSFKVSGLTAAIDKANGGDETEAPTTTTASNNDSNSTTTTTKAGDTTTASTTKSGSSDGTTVAQEDTTTATGDAGVAGIVLVCALTGAGVVATRKRG